MLYAISTICFMIVLACTYLSYKTRPLNYSSRKQRMLTATTIVATLVQVFIAIYQRVGV